jgi:hypothetical protein
MSDYSIGPAARSDLEEMWDHYGVELQNPNAPTGMGDPNISLRGASLPLLPPGSFSALW